jgi:hypothetical protein
MSSESRHSTVHGALTADRRVAEFQVRLIQSYFDWQDRAHGRRPNPSVERMKAEILGRRRR